MGWTEQDLLDLERRRAAESVAVQPVTQPKKSKFGNEWTEADGIRFQSKKEAEAYIKLKALANAGVIQKLELQPKLEVVAAFTHDGIKHRAAHYIGDFSYWQDGVRYVIDAKSKPTQTRVFRLKFKLAIRQNPEVKFEIW